MISVPAGFRAAIQAWISVKQAQTSWPRAHVPQHHGFGELVVEEGAVMLLQPKVLPKAIRSSP